MYVAICFIESALFHLRGMNQSIGAVVCALLCRHIMPVDPCKGFLYNTTHVNCHAHPLLTDDVDPGTAYGHQIFYDYIIQISFSVSCTILDIY